jgi:hypothetical protein
VPFRETITSKSSMTGRKLKKLKRLILILLKQVT